MSPFNLHYCQTVDDDLRSNLQETLKMSDVMTNDVKILSENRSIKFTRFGFLHENEPGGGKRVQSFEEASRCMENMRALMESNENINSVNSELAKLIKCCQDENDMQPLRLFR